MRKVALGSTFYFLYPSRAFATGIPEAVASADLSVIELDGTFAVIDTGATSAAHGSLTRVNVGTIIATTGNGYEYGKTYGVVLDTGTVDSVDAVGEVVYEFQIETATEEALRIFQEKMYPGSTLGASASHSTTVIDMTGAIDANTPAAGIVGEVLAVHDSGNDVVEFVRCTGFTATTLLATVQRIDDGGVMGFTPASGDHVWRIAVDPGRYNGTPVMVAGGQANLVDAPNATALGAIADAIADEPLSGHATAGTLGKAVADIEADTNELQTDWADGGRLDLLLDRLITELDTARAEPGQGAPAASAKIGAKVDYLYKAWRNKSEQTATLHSLYDDAGTTVDQKRTVSDDATTFTAQEVVTGP